MRKILVDEGSVENLMPKGTMEKLGITLKELSSSQLVINGFNLKTECAIDMIRVNLAVGDLFVDTLFNIINVPNFIQVVARPTKEA